MLIRLTGTPKRFATLLLEEGESTWEDLTAALSAHETGEKDGAALIPAIFRPCPAQCLNYDKRQRALKSKKDSIPRDCGGGKLHRLGANVEAMTALGVDLDDVPEADFARIIKNLTSRGLACWVWNTHSHTEGSGMVRARLLIPFHRPLPIPSHKAWSAAAWPNLVKWLGMEGAARADSACVDPCRIYYLPRKPAGLGEDTHASGFIAGAPLNWQKVLGDSLKGFTVPAALAPLPPPEDPTRPVDLEDFKRRLKSIGKEGTKRLISNVLAGRALVPPPETRPPGSPSRYVAWRQLTGAMAAQAHDWESSAVLLQVVRDTHAQEARESPGDFTDWDIVEHLFETARAGIPQLRAQWAAEQAADTAMFRRLMGEHAYRVAADPAPQAIAVSVREGETSAPISDSRLDAPPSEEDGEDWTQLVKLADNGEGVKNISANASIALAHHPVWKGVFRLNRVSGEIEMHGGPLSVGKVTKAGDTTATRVANWLQLDPFLNLQLSDNVVWAQIVSIAEHNAYDPLQEELNALAWDGTPRAADWLLRYMGVKSVDDRGKDVSAYVRAVGKRWLISAVARALDPGCKVDTVLHLEGLQGQGKSTALRILGGQFFSDAKVLIENKDTWAYCSKRWIVELGEVDTLRRSEVSAQKHFFSKMDDTYRKAYGRVDATYPRRCAFVGTLNPQPERGYLRDQTGNRRHWPVSCTTLDLDALSEDRDQLWAEAVSIYRAAETCDACVEAGKRCHEHRWWLTPAEEELQRQQVESRTEREGGLQEAVLAWWLRRAPDRRPEAVTTHEVITECLGESPARGLEIRVATALTALGFVRRRREVDGRTRRDYVPPADLAASSVRHVERSPLEAVAQARA